MTLSDDVKTQLDTMASHPALLLKRQSNGQHVGACFLIDHGESNTDFMDARNSVEEIHTPFTVEIHAASDADYATYLANVKAYIKSKSITGGWWKVTNWTDPNTVETSNNTVIGTVDGEQVVIA